MLLRSVGIRVVLSYGTYAKEIRRNKRRDSCAISCSESHSLHRTKRGDHRGVPNENLNLLTNPRDDWGAIVNEAADITSVYRHSRRDTLQAVKLVGFAATPVWLAGVFSLVPSLSMLSLIAGLYAVYLFYVGVGVLMQTPAEKVLSYMVVAGLVVVVVHVVVFSVAGSVFVTSAVTTPTLSLEQLLRESGAIGKI